MGTELTLQTQHCISDRKYLKCLQWNGLWPDVAKRHVPPFGIIASTTMCRVAHCVVLQHVQFCNGNAQHTVLFMLFLSYVDNLCSKKKEFFIRAETNCRVWFRGLCVCARLLL